MARRVKVVEVDRDGVELDRDGGSASFRLFLRRKNRTKQPQFRRALRILLVF